MESRKNGTSESIFRAGIRTRMQRVDDGQGCGDRAGMGQEIGTGMYTLSWLCSCCHVQLFATPWTVAHQAPLFIGFSRQEYWNGLPFASPGDLIYLGLETKNPALQADSLPSELPRKPPVNGFN